MAEASPKRSKDQRVDPQRIDEDDDEFTEATPLDSKGNVTFDDDFPPLDPEAVEAAKTADTEKYDEYVHVGMNKFFNNEFAEAERLFKEKLTEDPMCAMAYATVGWIKAYLSFEKEDIKAAGKRLKFAAKFADAVAPPKSVASRAVGAFMSLVSNRPKEILPVPYFRSRVIYAESRMLHAQLHLLEESIRGYLRCGLALRAGYNQMDELGNYTKNQPDHGVDRTSYGGMEFGLGSIHLVTSILPPKILRLLSALGYMHDREKGFLYLNSVLVSETIRAPIASLVLLVYHGVMPSFAVITIPRNVDRAEEVVAETLRMYPKSIIHLFMAGRVARLRRDMKKCIEIFNQCIDFSNDEMPQLKHFAQYELAWCYCSEMRWEEALKMWEILGNESNWSKPLYSYAQGAAHDMLGRHERAMELYKEALQASTKLLAGKTMSIDQFVKRRTALIVETKPDYCRRIPVLELGMHFNMFPQTPPENMKKMLEIVEEEDAKCGDREEYAMITLMRATLYRETGQPKEAEELYKELDGIPSLSEETWVKPYALYERSVLAYNSDAEDSREQALKHLKKLKKEYGGKDYNFEMQMAFRLHLTKDILKEDF